MKWYVKGTTRLAPGARYFLLVGLVAGIVLLAAAASVAPVTAQGTLSWSTATLSQARIGLSGAAAGNKALFAGGDIGNNIRVTTVDIYDATTGTWSTASLSQARSNLATATLGNKAFFAGGYGPPLYSNRVDIYDATASAWSTATLSQARYAAAGAGVGNKALFAGGSTGSIRSNVVDIYDATTGAWSTATLSQAREQVAAATVGNKAFFAGGWTGSAASNVVDIYDATTGVWSTATLSQARGGTAAAAVGNKALFAGGDNTGNWGFSNVVDIAELQAIVVNSTGDAADAVPSDGVCSTGATIASGAAECTLRAAIQTANAVSGADTINFNIPGTAPYKIYPNSTGLGGLPEVTDPVTIDATTQPGFTSTPKVEIGGEYRGPSITDGLYITTGGSTIKGLSIYRWGNGIHLTTGGGSNNIKGNYFGVDSSGNYMPSNVGVRIDSNSSNNVIGGTTSGERNWFYGHYYQAIIVDNVSSGATTTGYNRIRGNEFQYNGVGIDIIGSAGNDIGDTTAGARNYIYGGVSGDFAPGHGIWLRQGANNNRILGNYIGTNSAGNAYVGLHGDGVHIEGGSYQNIIGGTTAAARNVISNNDGDGIEIDGSTTTANIVQGNYIGTNLNGTGALGNHGHGIFITQGSNGNYIGGPVSAEDTPSGARNLIAYNGGDGVFIDSGSGNFGSLIRWNSIFSNGGLGIDLGTNGVTANDAGDGDTGANNLQNFPVLSSVSTSGGTTTIQGTLNSAANTTFTLDYYSSAAADPSGFGEGQTWLGSASVTTDGQGNGSFTFTASAIPLGYSITATATDPNNNTSEFSQAQLNPAADLAITKVDSPDPVTVQSNLTYTITVTNNGPSPATGVTLTDNMPNGVTFLSVQGDCTGILTSTITCNLGTLNNGASAIVAITVQPASVSSLTNTASVSATEPDPNANNNTATATTTVRASPPTVSSVSPGSGPTAGGTSVTISGSNFVATPTVTFGGVAATSVVWVSATSLTAVTPAHAAGVVDVVVTNPDGQSATLVSSYTYVAPLSITTTSLPGGMVGVAYSQALATTGGTTPYTWSIAAGSLPPGLTLVATTGVLSGTPTTAGNYSFTVQVTDSSGSTQTATQALSITLTPTPIPLSTISTVAGTGMAGYSGDGGLATSAKLFSPMAVAADSQGNLFITDADNGRLRKIDTSGTITTVGGLVISGSVMGLAVDGQGNLFIAEPNDHRVRKVDGSGTISNVAGTGTAGFSGDGGPATSAQLFRPGWVAVDGQGNLFISDADNHRIRKVATNGIITTVAGNGPPGYSGDGGPALLAGLNHPGGIAVDSQGNLFIADTFNYRVRRVDTFGTITTVAGCGYGCSWELGDGGPATSAYVVPLSVVVDSQGSIFISHIPSNWAVRVRKVDTNGVITTVAGTGVEGYGGDADLGTSATLSAWGIAVDTQGNLFIADAGNNRIRKVIPGRGGYKVKNLPSGVRMWKQGVSSTETTVIGHVEDIQGVVGKVVNFLKIPVVELSLKFSQVASDIDFGSQMKVDADLTSGKAVFHSDSYPLGVGLEKALYVRRLGSHDRVRVCPGAQNLQDVTSNCANGYVLTLANSNVTLTPPDPSSGYTFWRIAGLTGTGAQSEPSPEPTLTPTAASTTSSASSTGPVSRGIGRSVPDPATWALVLSGLAALGLYAALSMRRRKA